MALSDLQVFDEFLQTSLTELLDQNIELFNAATRGGIILRPAAHEGSFTNSTIWSKISGLVRRRDAFGSGAVTPKVLTQLLDVSVKVAAGTPPVEIEPGMLEWIQKQPEEAGVVYGTQLAEEMLADMLNIALSSFFVAVGQVAALINDVSGGSTASLQALNGGASKFGDRANAIVAWAMHSTQLFDIFDKSITNAERLFQFGTVQVVQDGFGRPFVVSDSPSLITTGTPDKFHALGLTAGAVLVDQNNDFTQNIETSNGEENILRTIQSEWSYNVGVKGFAWDQTNGGASPTDAALKTATNWDRFSTADKDLAGVIVTTD